MCRFKKKSENKRAVFFLFFCFSFACSFFFRQVKRRGKRKQHRNKNRKKVRTKTEKKTLSLRLHLRPMPPALPFIFFGAEPPAPPAAPPPPPPGRLATPSFLTGSVSAGLATGLKNESSLPCCALAPAAPRRASEPRMRASSKSFSRTRNWTTPSTSGFENLIGGSWSSVATVGSVFD